MYRNKKKGARNKGRNDGREGRWVGKTSCDDVLEDGDVSMLRMGLL
jgi:hypothetical protein